MIRISPKAGILLTGLILLIVGAIYWPQQSETSVLDAYLEATAPPLPDNIFVGDEIIPPVPAPDFDLINYTGERVSIEDFSGKVLLLSFAYTSCPDTCPVLFGRFLAIQNEMSAAIGEDIELAFISIDPEVDTPERLSAHVGAMNGSWYYLTEDLPVMEEVWDAFNLYVEKEGAIVSHTNLTLLIDQQGLARVQYIGLPPESVFINDIENLLANN
jgi:protein SCO1/2